MSPRFHAAVCSSITFLIAAFVFSSFDCAETSRGRQNQKYKNQYFHSENKIPQTLFESPADFAKLNGVAENTFDYIIAGGGMAGLSLAFYLNESADFAKQKSFDN